MWLALFPLQSPFKIVLHFSNSHW